MSLENSLESDFNWAGISRTWKYWWLQKDETPRSEKILIGEYVSESEIELKLATMGYGVLDRDVVVGGGFLRKIGRTAWPDP